MNPRDEYTVDDVSGIKVKNQRYLDYQDGLKEAVDYFLSVMDPEDGRLIITPEALQIQLKEWGIEK